MNTPRFLITGFVCGLALLLWDGCAKPERSSEGKKITIAVIPKGANQVFWKSVHAGAVKAAEELSVDVIWKGPIKEDDRESQIKVVEDFVTRGVAGIVLAPLDATALKPAVNDAVRNKIPVVIIDSDLNSDQYVSFVATENYEGGKKAGHHLARLLGSKGKVIVLRFLEGSASTEARVQGFLDALKEHPGIEVVSSNQRSGSTAEVAYQTSENLLAPYKKPGGISIDGLFCPNEFTTFAMLRALQDGALAGKVKLVGFDSSDMLVNAMKNGQIHGLVLQDPINMGYLGVKTMVAHLNGEKIERRIDTGSTVATPENMNDPSIKGLLEPDFKKWLKEQ
jgi:ribose transport system substrate-binding protein